MSLPRVLLLLVCLHLHAAETMSPVEGAYAAISQGRPAEAVGPLHAHARGSQVWHRWYDCANAAWAAGHPGHAAAWFLHAATLAPAEPAPRAALAAMELDPPPTWIARMGLLGVLLRGVAGLGLLFCGGALLGWALLGPRRHRLVAAVAGAVLLTVALPVQIALQLDRAHLAQWNAVVRNTHLLSSTGTPTRPLPAGTLVRRLPREPWAGQVLVDLGNGRRGYVALADLDAGWPPEQAQAPQTQ
ncbi:MAG: hypothetical protein ACOCYP_07240 [Planctomycetota bacterium]